MSDSLVIDWDRDRLIATSGSAGRNIVSLSKLAVSRLENENLNAQEIGDQLAQSLKSAGISAEQAVVVFPRSMVTFRRLQLPNVSDDELPAMIRLQAATRLTVPVDSVCLDYTPLATVTGSETREVLLVTLPQKNVSQVKDALTAAGLELAGVRVSSFGVAASVVHAGLVDQSKSTTDVESLIWLREDMIEMIFMQGQSVLFSHSGASWASTDKIEQAVRAEVSRARLAATEDIGEFKTHRLTLIGSKNVIDAVPDSIAQRLNDAEVRRIDPDDTLLNAPSAQDASPSQLLACAGVIANLQVRTVESVDLINPRKAKEKKDNRRLQVLLTVGASLLLLTGGWKLRDSTILNLETKTKSVTSETSTLAKEFRDARPQLALDNELTTWRQRDISWLDEMQKIQQLMGGTDRVLIRRFDFSTRQGDSAATIKADGYAKSRRDVEDLMRTLREAGYGVTPSEIVGTSRDPAYSTELSLELIIPDPDETNEAGSSS